MAQLLRACVRAGLKQRLCLIPRPTTAQFIPSQFSFVGSTFRPQQLIGSSFARAFCSRVEVTDVTPDKEATVAETSAARAKEGSQAKSHSFQAETRQLLDIVTNSLYTDKEVFLRELISNAADALEKARHIQSAGTSLIEPDTPLEIRIFVDEEAKTIVIQDTGVGMNAEELHQNIGTIARSGSKAFVQSEKSKGGQGEVLGNMIGQFGVGFYASFMVANEVEVFSKSALPGAESYLWKSDGTGDYEVSEAEGVGRGTRIVLHLKGECEEFASKGKIEEIIKKYSNFINFPIILEGEKINTVEALWKKNKNEISDEDHESFYKFISNAYDKPRYNFHFAADAPIQLNALCYIGSQHMEKFGAGRMEPNMSLYSRKVLIESKSKHLLPEWLRFVSGVVDSEDVPLSISREGMQDSTLIKRIQSVLTKRMIRFLQEQAKKDSKGYIEFFDEFGNFLKEGVCQDFDHKNDIAKLLRFESSTLPQGELTSLDEYISRCTPEQKKVYYLTAPDRKLAEASAYYEVFEDSSTEVLFMYSPIDDFVMTNLNEYNGRALVTAETASVDELDGQKKSSVDGEDDSEKSEDVAAGDELAEDDAKALAEWMQSALEDHVSAVRTTSRLRSSPAIVVDHESGALRRMMKMVEHQSSRSGGAAANFMPKQTLEINPSHPVIVNLQDCRLRDPSGATLVAEQLFDNALITAGLMDDSRQMLPRLNKLMEMALRNNEQQAAANASIASPDTSEEKTESP